MAGSRQNLDRFVGSEYPHGFVTDLETDSLPADLGETVIRQISARKHEPDFMLQWRLKAYQHWLTLKVPKWSKLHYPPIDYDQIVFYSA